MNDQQILEKAIQKAIDGGWKREYSFSFSVHDEGVLTLELPIGVERTTEPLKHNDIYALIFSHDFAKALWGEKEHFIRHSDGQYVSTLIPSWQYHLQQMVIADDPIKYLGDNI